jgi:hypothetical protein
VAETDGRVQIDEAGIAGGLSIAVGHADRDHLLQTQHIAKIVGKIAEHRQFGRFRVAENRSRAEGAEQGEDSIPHICLRPKAIKVRHWEYLLR